MFDLAADRSLIEFYLPVPIDTSISRGRFKVGWTFGNPIINVGCMFVLLDIIAFVDTSISGITINDIIIRSDKTFGLVDVMDIC